jgi:predicted transcriptional regulator
MASAKLTHVEWEIMEAVWELGGAPSVRDVLEHKYPDGEKAYTTVQTIMNNLVKKELLAPQKIGLVNFYAPTQTRVQMVEQETSSLVSRIFHGSVPALANFLIDSNSLTLDEIGKIKKAISQKEKDLKGK